MIDVIIPGYNCTKTIARALFSLCAQTSHNFKVYFVDDCSTDNPEPIINSFKSLLDITYLKNETNIGCGMSRQTGIDNSHSPFFCFMDADDCMLPNAIEIYENLIAEHPAELFITSFYREDKKDKQHPYKTEIYFNAPTWCHGKLYRRSSIEKFGIRNNPDFSRWADDSYFNSICTELLKIYVSDKITYLWTDTVGSATNSNLNYGVPKNEIFLHAMVDSAEFVLKYKNEVAFVEKTLENAPKPTTLMEQYYVNRLIEIKQLSH